MSTQLPLVLAWAANPQVASLAPPGLALPRYLGLAKRPSFT
ncbi:MAG: hypothetical protein SFV32_04630 [Opitutaceae bacterium]|nr:hypothetical protein [Opitutaceae bacterium]